MAFRFWNLFQFSTLSTLLFLLVSLLAQCHSASFKSYPTAYQRIVNSGSRVRSPARQPAFEDIIRNVGPAFVPKGSRPMLYRSTIVSLRPSFPAFYFRTAVEGNSFSVTFNIPPSTYDVQLGFVQTQQCQTGLRLFNILINGQLRDESFDVFATAGCNNGIINQYNRQVVDPIADNKGLTISLYAVSGVATLSYIRIRRSIAPCVPEMSAKVPTSAGEEHYAHAVPGTYPSNGEAAFVDRLNIGFYNVLLDGSGSHTHFNLHNYTARITSYEWTRQDTGKLISKKPKFRYRFPLGTTVLRLKVTDSVCSQHEETTSVTVTGNLQNGVICYVYKDTGIMLYGSSLVGVRRPIMSFISPTLSIQFPSDILQNAAFAARCVFMLLFRKSSDDTRASVSTRGSGPAHLYQGSNRLYDTVSPGNWASISHSEGYTAYAMTYLYKRTYVAPFLKLTVDGVRSSEVAFDAATTLPIVSSLSPNTGASGGTDVRITGYNFYPPLTVHFGNVRAVVKTQASSLKQITVISPLSSTEKIVSVSVRTGKNFVSNGELYSYSTTCDDIRFDSSFIVDKTGRKVVVPQPTAMTLGQDGALYVATLIGQIYKIVFNHDTHVTNYVCQSEVFVDPKWKNAAGVPAPRAFLGIAIDPRHVRLRLYVSASTIFYRRRDAPISKSNLRAWSNGAVERFKPASAATRAKNPNQCLEHDTNIVDGLPVSNADHAVNAIVFTQNGDLLIAVGSNTNMGLPNPILGGDWESHFSAAVLIARISRPLFNGTIPYTTPENLRTARPSASYDDVDLYATGFRNPFTMAMVRSGRIYAVDNGPNRGFGDAASSCDEYNEMKAANLPRNANVSGGGAILGTGQFRYTDSRPDKLVLLNHGSYYGHPNLQRSVHLGINECAYVDPLTGKTPPPKRDSPPKRYRHQVALLESPVTGLLEYGGNHFCASLRGNLIFSKLKARGTFTTAVNDNGIPVETAYMLSMDGGLSVVEDSSGALVFGKFVANPTDGFIVLKPRVSVTSKLLVWNAVPYRHGMKGGTKIHIGGNGFTSNAVVRIGGKLCSIVKISTISIVCKVPSKSRASSLADLTVEVATASVTLKNAVLYMTV